jgi:hypothetical protein
MKRDKSSREFLTQRYQTKRKPFSGQDLVENVEEFWGIDFFFFFGAARVS